jgi:hypothetical protein
MSNELERAKRGTQIIDDEGEVWTFDATVSEGHKRSADLSKHPVPKNEDGTFNEVADHVRVTEPILSLRGVITNTPIDGDADSERVKKTFEIMNQLLEARRVVTVITGLKSYSDMILTKVDVDRSRPTQSISPVVEFERVRFATLQIVPVPADILATENKRISDRRQADLAIANAKASAQAKKDGEQQAKKAADANDVISMDKNKTLAANGLDAMAKFMTNGFSAVPL